MVVYRRSNGNSFRIAFLVNVNFLIFLQFLVIDSEKKFIYLRRFISFLIYIELLIIIPIVWFFMDREFDNIDFFGVPFIFWVMMYSNTTTHPYWIDDDELKYYDEDEIKTHPFR